MTLLAKIELIQVLNCHNNIQLFPQQFEKVGVNGDINSHLKVLGMKQTVE